MKRFVETAKWSDGWYSNLSPVAKQVLDYLRDNCDHAGVWDVNLTKAENEIGLHKLPKRFTHPGLRGIEYTDHGVAEEDVMCRGLDTALIQQVKHIQWRAVLDEINTPHQHQDELQFEAEPKELLRQIVLLNGGRKWWLTKFILFQYGREGKIVLNENNTIHIPVVRSLRTHNLMDEVKKLFPSAVIVEKGAPIPQELAKGLKNPPTLEEVQAHPMLAEKEFAGTPPEVIKEFYYTNQRDKWKRCEDWEAGMRTWLMVHNRRATGHVETVREKQIRLDKIEDRMMEINQDKDSRWIPPGGTMRVLTPKAAEELKQLRELRDKLKEEIRKGGNG